MVLVKDRIIIAAPRGKKPTSFRFRGMTRFGIRRRKIVEVTLFKEKGGQNKMVGRKIVRRQIRGTREIIRGQARGTRDVRAAQRKTFKKQAKRARRSTKRILTGKR